MRNFLIKFGINVEYDRPINNKKINWAIFILDVVYFAISVYNLFCSKSISGFTVALNTISFVNMFFLNVRNELDNLRKNDRYSLYFTLFILELFVLILVSGALMSTGGSLESMKYFLLVLYSTTLANKFIHFRINLYKQI